MNHCSKGQDSRIVALPHPTSSRCWLRGPATTCRRTGRWASASRSRSKSVFQSRPRVHQMSQQLCAHRPLDDSTRLPHAQLTFPAHSLCYLRRSMCSGHEEDHPDPARRHGLPDHRPPRVTSRGRRARGRPRPPFRNGNAPPAAVRPRSSPPWSVYHSLSIVPVGAVPPPRTSSSSGGGTSRAKYAP